MAFMLQASTIGIATGSKTSDGRPLLFKNKDRADNYPSDVNFYAGRAGEYSYVFQQNDGQDHTRARMGINSAGFGVVYSDSENLSGAESGPYGSQLTAIALKSCASLDDFRELLNTTAGERRVHNHFAVIDASGAGSLFEVDGYAHVEIQITDSIGTMANTAKYHPSAGPPASGSTSPQREARAAYLLNAGPEEGLDYRYFVQEIIKDYCTTQADEDRMPDGSYQTNAVLSRYKTAAGCVIKGTIPGDDPRVEAIMWLCLSESSLSVALPFLPAVNIIPQFIRSDAEDDGMAGSADRLRRLVYDYTDGRYADRYADTDQLEAIRSHTMIIQDSLFNSYDAALPEWKMNSYEASTDSMKNWLTAQHLWAKQQYDFILTLLPVEHGTNDIPSDFRLMQNFPNPFNDSTVIPFYLPRPGRVSLEIFTIQGKRIWMQTTPNLPAGHHRIKFENTALSAGIYFYTLHHGSFNLTRKMVYLP